MPREARVAVNDAVQVVKEFILLGYFKENKFPIKNSEVWIQMSLRFNNKWSARDVYREVRENRRKILTKAREEVGVPVINNSSSNMKLEDNISSDTESDNLSDVNDCEWEAPGLETVLLPISEEFFNILHEREPVYYKKRKYTTLERFKWASILAEKIYLHTYLPCSFVFKNCKIYPDEGSVHYLTLRGKCQSEVCGNKIFGFLDKKPSSFPCDLRLRMKDTFGEAHEEVRRPTRKFQRLIIGEQALNEGVGNFTKRQEALHAKDNKRLPPILPKQNIIRQCKNEFIYHKLGVKPRDGHDVVSTIENMRYNPLYPEFIHEVKRDKFYVSYSTRNQLVSYKRYCKLIKTSRVAIDGTGSIIQPITHPNGKKTGHLFFYTVVINFKNKTHPVHQLLTESQNTQTFIWWLKYWLSMGANKPTEANCDSSRALINALSFSFNDQSIKVYIETLYLRAIGDTSHVTRPPIFTYIRLDVAHFIHMISEWKCLKNQKNSLVKNFYIYCIALMIDCQTVEQFRTIYRLICIVGLNERDDSIIKNGKTVAQARHELKTFIAVRDLSHIVDKVNSSEISETTQRNDPDEEKDNECSDHESQSSPVKIFINNIYNSAKDIKILGKVANAYYAEDFIREFLARAYEFPLWTSSCLPGEIEHATTSYVEQFFGDKKERSLKNWNSLVRADVFLKHEYEEYNGSSAELQSNLITENERENLYNKSKQNNNELNKNDNNSKNKPKKNCDSTANFKQNNIDEMFDQEKSVNNNDSIIINDSNENIPFASTPEKSVEIDLNEHLESDVNNSEHLENYSNDRENRYELSFDDDNESLKDVKEQIIHDRNDKVSNSPEEIFSSSMDIADETNEKLSFTVTCDNDEKNYPEFLINFKDKKSKIFNDSDVISRDNWRNKGRVSNYDYYNSLNVSKENDEPPIQVFKKKILASPEKLQPLLQTSPEKLQPLLQTKILKESFNINENKSKTLSSSTHIHSCDELKNIKEKHKNLIKIDQRPKKQDFHFQPTPDILHQTISPSNTTHVTKLITTKKQKILRILQNGNKRNPISVNGVDILLLNTCAFDSLIHVLAVAGKDDRQFLTYMDKNLNPTLKFICDFIDKGPIISIYKKRTVLLSQLFEEKIVKKKKESDLYANELNMWSSISEMWARCFPNSACFSHICEICGECKLTVSMVQVNHKILWEGGFSKLQESVTTFDARRRCTKCKLRMVNSTLLFNRCICIELNIQMYKSGSLSCKLEDIPPIIKLNNINYQLRGVIECKFGHFKAYCRRNRSYWSLYDDNATKVTTTLPSKIITPDAAIFTRIQ